MSKIVNIINAGGMSATPLILDLYPDTEYFYSPNRGGANTTDVVQGRNNQNNFQDFTPEELEDVTFSAFASGGGVRVRKLYNQGTVNRTFEQTTAVDMPNLGNPDLYKFNDKIFMSGVERNSFIETDSKSTLLDSDSTVYLVFRSESQTLQGVQGVFEETQGNQRRIAIYSDTRNFNFRHSNFVPDGAPNFISFTSQQPTETIRLYALRRTGNLVEAFDENGLVGSITSSDSFGGNALFVLFRQTAGPRFFRGHVAELMIRKKSDTNTDLNTIINHRKEFYGIN